MIELKKGDIVKGKVTGIEKYGIFLNVNNYFDGLVHISEISDDFVKDIHDYVKISEIIYSEVLEIDVVNKRLKLSIKNINYKYANNSKIKETVRGFLPLKENLNAWIKDRLDYYKEIDDK